MITNKFAIVFPGQGSQSVGMIADLAVLHPEVINTFSQASEVLDYDLWDLVQNGPTDKLNQTVHTQPALLAASIAVWEVFKKTNPNTTPSVLAGHSLGEYTALVAAQSLAFTDAISLVAARGKFMTEAVPDDMGAMAAILGIDDNKIIKDCIAEFDTVEIANLNAIGQTVIAGKKASVLLAIDKLKNNGAKLAKLLDVSVPSHCSLMQPAALELEKLLNKTTFKAPSIPVIHNYSVQSYNSGAEIREALVKQLVSPVRWVEVINYIYTLGIIDIYEFGPNSVLTKLCKRINPNVNCTSINSSDALSTFNSQKQLVLKS